MTQTTQTTDERCAMLANSGRNAAICAYNVRTNRGGSFWISYWMATSRNCANSIIALRTQQAAIPASCPNGYGECWDGCAYPGRCGGPRVQAEAVARTLNPCWTSEQAAYIAAECAKPMPEDC